MFFGDGNSRTRGTVGEERRRKRGEEGSVSAPRSAPSWGGTELRFEGTNGTLPGLGNTGVSAGE